MESYNNIKYFHINMCHNSVHEITASHIYMGIDIEIQLKLMDIFRERKAPENTLYTWSRD